MELRSAIEYHRSEGVDWHRLPSLQKRKTLPPKAMVKLIFMQRESPVFMWAEVQSKGTVRYTGKIAPSPWNLYLRLPKGTKRGDKIEFMPKHIYDIRIH